MSRPRQSLKSLLAHEPQYVWFSEHTPREAGFNPTKISITELEQRVGGGFRYSESTHYDLQLPQKENDALAIKNKKLKDMIQHYLTNTQAYIDRLVICPTGGNTGLGVFAREDIPENTLVCLYSGTLTKVNDHTDDSYCFRVIQTSDQSPDYQIDARRQGGIARFVQSFHRDLDQESYWFNEVFQDSDRRARVMALYNSDESSIRASQHSSKNPLFLPSPQEYKQRERAGAVPAGMAAERLCLDPSLPRTEVAFDNLQKMSLSLEGRPLIAFYTKHTVRAGEHLGIDYDIGYFLQKQRTMAKLFWRNGGVIPDELYHYLGLFDIMDGNIVIVSEEELSDKRGSQTHRTERGVVPFYGMRQSFLLGHALPKPYQAQPGNLLLEQLQKKCSSALEFVKAYHRWPEDSTSEASTVDIVIQFPEKNEESLRAMGLWIKLTSLRIVCQALMTKFKTSLNWKNIQSIFKKIEPLCIIHEEAGQIILTHVNEMTLDPSGPTPPEDPTDVVDSSVVHPMASGFICEQLVREMPTQSR